MKVKNEGRKYLEGAVDEAAIGDLAEEVEGLVAARLIHANHTYSFQLTLLLT